MQSPAQGLIGSRILPAQLRSHLLRHGLAHLAKQIRSYFQACRLPAPKRSKRSKPSKPPKRQNPTPRPDPSLLQGGPECRLPGFRSQQASQGLLPAQAKATPRPDPSLLLGGPACRSPGLRSQQASQGHIHGLLMGFQACRLPAPKRSKPSKPPKRQNPTPRPDPSLLQGGPECRLPGFRSQQASQATATPRPDPSLLLGGPACRSPGLRSQQASQGHIHGFLWTSKLAVCQPLNAPNAPNPPNPPCRLPAPKRSKRSKPSKPPKRQNPTPRPDPSLLQGGPECRSPGFRLQGRQDTPSPKYENNIP